MPPRFACTKHLIRAHALSQYLLVCPSVIYSISNESYAGWFGVAVVQMLAMARYPRGAPYALNNARV